MTQTVDRSLVWFRRDLRADDHAALHHALRLARQVWCVFVFDRDILDPLGAQGIVADRRVDFIHASVVELDAELAALGRSHGVAAVGLLVRHGRASEVVPQLAGELGVQLVSANHDDEPAALARDALVRTRLAAAGIDLRTFKDHVLAERREVLTAAGGPFSVFTPYKNAWLRWLQPEQLQAHEVAQHAAALAPLSASQALTMPSLATLGFIPSKLGELRLPTGSSGAQALLDDFLQRIGAYADTRDLPAVKGPSYLSTHLRFGTVSIRQLARLAWARSQAGSRGAQVWLSELVWRDFYHQILFHHPRVVDHAFKPECDAIAWEQGAQADADFAAWCDGRTGYPLVDAAMQQINQTGYMHNRLRMVVASFLVKDLGLDWRRGEAYFARHLIDFDLAANNGGWQWAASTGCDAQPWFRIFNPVTQSQRFDPQGKFIRRYLPQLTGLADNMIHAPWLARPADLASAGLVLGRDYPAPIVDHDLARKRTLARFAAVRPAKPVLG